MDLRRYFHPIWGDNLGNQVEAPQTHFADGGYRVVQKRAWGGFGPMRTNREPVGRIEKPVTDGDAVKREFRYRCAVTKITVSGLRNRNPQFTVAFDGLDTCVVSALQFKMRVAPGELTKSGGDPVADVLFTGVGPRFGPLKDYEAIHITCSFADWDQANDFFMQPDLEPARRTLVSNRVVAQPDDEDAYDPMGRLMVMGSYLSLQHRELIGIGELYIPDEVKGDTPVVPKFTPGGAKNGYGGGGASGDFNPLPKQSDADTAGATIDPNVIAAVSDDDAPASNVTTVKDDTSSVASPSVESASVSYDSPSSSSVDAGPSGSGDPS